MSTHPIRLLFAKSVPLQYHGRTDVGFSIVVVPQLQLCDNKAVNLSGRMDICLNPNSTPAARLRPTLSGRRIVMPNALDWQRLFRSESPQIRKRAATALIGCDDIPLEIVLEILDQFPNDRLGSEAERVLLERNGVELFAPMVQRLTSTEVFIREVACKLLGRSKDLNAAPHLVSLLNDSDVSVRCAAGTGLTLLANPSTIETLRRHLQTRISDYGGTSWWIEAEIEKLERRYPQQSRTDVLNDSLFGSLIPNLGRTGFVAVSSFQEAEIRINFEANTYVKLQELINFAKPLWEERLFWFSMWRDKIYDYYVSHLAENWWEEDYALTQEIFYQLLGWPIEVRFLFLNRRLNYVLVGWSEELFSDHGIDVTGSSASDMEVVF